MLRLHYCRKQFVAHLQAAKASASTAKMSLLPARVFTHAWRKSVPHQKLQEEQAFQQLDQPIEEHCSCYWVHADQAEGTQQSMCAQLFITLEF